MLLAEALWKAWEDHTHIYTHQWVTPADHMLAKLLQTDPLLVWVSAMVMSDVVNCVCTCVLSFKSIWILEMGWIECFVLSVCVYVCVCFSMFRELCKIDNTHRAKWQVFYRTITVKCWFPEPFLHTHTNTFYIHAYTYNTYAMATKTGYLTLKPLLKMHASKLSWVRMYFLQPPLMNEPSINM